MSSGKKFWQSKLFWAGVGQIVASIGLLLSGEQAFAEWLLGGSGVMTIILRTVTDTSIEWKI